MILRHILFLCISALLLIMPHNTYAQSSSVGTPFQNITDIHPNLCSLTGNKDKRPEAILKLRSQYDCGKDKNTKVTDYIWFIAPISDAQKNLIEPVLRIRTARHGDIDVYRQYEDGSILHQKLAIETMHENWRSPYAVAANLLDASGRKPTHIIIGVDKPWDPQNLQDIEILEKSEDLRLERQNSELSALFAGLLLAPLLLNLVIIALIRQAFIFYHTIMVVSIGINHISWTGQIFTLFSDATMAHRSAISHIALAMIGFGACMLIRAICDPKKLGSLMRHLLCIGSVACVIVTVCVTILAPSLPLIGSQIFHIFFAFMAAIGLCALIYASLRGDKMAMLQLLGLSGAIIVASIRVGRALGWFYDVPVLDFEFNLAVLLELLTISYIVGLRAKQLRQSRDAAVEESKVMGRLAYTDPLTQLLNRRGFMIRYDKIAAQSEKRNIHYALMLMDIDKFKQVNDTYGHDVGDEVLIQMSELLRKTCREDDVYARHGGEEFILLISSHQENGVDAFANRLCESIANNEFKHNNVKIEKITTSIGIVSMDLELSRNFDAYYRAADKALYVAKNSGRNQIAYGELTNIKDETLAQKKGGDEFTPATS